MGRPNSLDIPFIPYLVSGIWYLVLRISYVVSRIPYCSLPLAKLSRERSVAAVAKAPDLVGCDPIAVHCDCCCRITSRRLPGSRAPPQIEPRAERPPE